MLVTSFGERVSSKLLSALGVDELLDEPVVLRIAGLRHGSGGKNSGVRSQNAAGERLNVELPLSSSHKTYPKKTGNSNPNSPRS